MPSHNASASYHIVTDTPRKDSPRHKGEKVDGKRKDLITAMDGKFVQVKLEEFMDKFVRCTGDSPKEDWQGMFDNVKKGMSEADIQNGFMEAITKKNILGDDYKAVSSPNRSDPSDASRQKPDAGVYPTSTAPTDERTHWATKRLSIEFKKEPTQDDPFDDDDPLGSFEATALKRQANRGQIIHSVSEIFLRQHRCFLYSVIILGTSARIIRWDRSGALVTTKFDYKEGPQTICEFLWYFGRMSSKDQGYDPSAVPVVEGSDDYVLMNDKAEEELPRDENNNENVRDYVRKYFKQSLADGWQRYKVEVPLNEDNEDTYAKIYGHGAAHRPTTKTGEKKTGTFLICQPHFSAFGVVGRGTRGYVAIDCATKDFVFLKDAWRVDLPDIEREGDVLQTLNDKGVRNIPTVLCHGDILAQYTETQNLSPFFTKLFPPQNRLKTHCHYRLVEKEVGQSLEEFYHSQDLVWVVLGCLFAHSDAVNKAGILHRDISSGNLLMVKEKRPDGSIRHRGLLNDWELSKKIPVVNPSEDVPQSSARQPDRTATASLNDKYKQMVLQDDLESFFHVLLYMAIQYLPSNCSDVEKFIEDFFEAARISGNEYTCGGDKWTAMYTGLLETSVGIAREPLRFYLPFEDGSNDTASPSIYRTDRPANLPDHAVTVSHEPIAHPINEIFDTLLSWFSAYYEERRRSLAPRGCTSVSTTVQSPEDEYRDDPVMLAIDPEKIAATKPVAGANLKDTKFAENLATHTLMLQHLWLKYEQLPKNDKIDVRAIQARDFTHHDQVVVPAAPARIGSSSKHDPDPERDVEAPPPKRLRTSQIGSVLAVDIKRPLSRHPASGSNAVQAPARNRKGNKAAGPSKIRGSTQGSRGYSRD
ncbi:hypothetical protein B0H21DRAFT_706122 [Amylocystis lapponica]|nr:hypothetical protein B0H21DRAFT_706122 [Amylocystis lapponica]